MDLTNLRERITDVDRQIIELVAERQRLSGEIARAKRAIGHATRDFRRERDVIMNARATALRAGLPPEVAESILRMLIRASLAHQEQAQVAYGNSGTGRRVLVIGGRGKIGGWFAHFLDSQGFVVEVADPAGPLDGYAYRVDWRESPLDHDIVVVATPLGATEDILGELAARRPRGLVFDVGSIKTPLRAGLEALRLAGVKVTSLHPMFGPDTDLLSGRHVIFIDLGSPTALDEAQSLFAATMAEQVVMSLDDHDRLIAYVLGLSHAVNIAFFTALADSGEAAPRLARLSSTTFDAQLEIASDVAQESPALYFEIQALNEYGTESLDALADAVERIRATVRSSDAEGFAQLMLRGRAYFEGRAAVRPEVEHAVR
jgi:chorismate mutase / prephenate dehydrogenase